MSAGDTMEFRYDINTITPAVITNPGEPPIFYNITTTITNYLTLEVVSVGLRSGVDAVHYKETVTIVNSTTIPNPETNESSTAIFNPYDNDTYLGTIGFWPFTYSDLPAGQTLNIPVTVTIPSPTDPSVIHNVTSSVNASVARTSDSIDINFTVRFPHITRPFRGALQYDINTGVLKSGSISSHIFDNRQVLVYTLVSFNRPLLPSLPVLLYLAAIVPVVLLFVYIARRERKPPGAKKAKRLRDRLRRGS